MAQPVQPVAQPVAQPEVPEVAANPGKEKTLVQPSSGVQPHPPMVDLRRSLSDSYLIILRVSIRALVTQVFGLLFLA